MKTYHLYFASLAITIFAATGCGRNDRSHANDVKQPLTQEEKAIEKAVEGDRYSSGSSLEFSSRGKYQSDKVSEMFQHYLKQNDALGNLLNEKEDALNDSWDFQQEEKKKVNNSTDFYASARNHIYAIQDSVLAKTIQTKLEQHEKQFNALVEPYLQSDSLLQAQKVNLQDVEQAIMVVKTMEMIGEYQQSHQPDVEKTNEWIKDMKDMKGQMVKHME